MGSIVFPGRYHALYSIESALNTVNNTCIIASTLPGILLLRVLALGRNSLCAASAVN